MTDAPLYVAYTELREATDIFLRRFHPDATLVFCKDDPTAYRRHFERCWATGQTFVNMEHDIVPWPGAIESLLACPAPWCVYSYQADDVLDNGINTGLVKFSESFIRTLPGVWEEMVVNMGPNVWDSCDIQVRAHAERHGIYPHQHFPSVLNANPRYLALEMGRPEL